MEVLRSSCAARQNQFLVTRHTVEGGLATELADCLSQFKKVTTNTGVWTNPNDCEKEITETFPLNLLDNS